MRIGINMPFQQPDGAPPTVEQVFARARLIEDIGFDGIWLGDLISRAATTRPDPLMWLLLAASATKRIEVGTSILQVPLRNPVELANRLITMHALTGGRFSAGLGAGSTRADYEACGVDYTQRFRLLNEYLPVIRGLVKGEQVGAANLHPWPATAGGPPMLVGAWESGIWVKRAAQQYDGWIASARSPLKNLAEGIKRFRDFGGGRAMVATIPLDLSKPNAPFSEDDEFSLVCGPESASERLHRLEDLGFDDALIVRMNHTEADLTEEHLRAIRALI